MLRWLPLMIVVGCSSAPMLAPRTDLVSAERPQPRRERPRRVSVEASVRVDGRRADVAAVLTFQNPDDAQAEAVVTLALPAGADRRRRGGGRGRRAPGPAASPQEALRAAGTLERTRDDELRLRVFPVPAGRRLARLRYHHRLPLDGLGYSRFDLAPPRGLAVDGVSVAVEGRVEKRADGGRCGCACR
ncbi:MAG: hypothetical protein R3F43_10560 [bacterium]